MFNFQIYNVLYMYATLHTCIHNRFTWKVRKNMKSLIFFMSPAHIASLVKNNITMIMARHANPIQKTK